MFVPNVTLARLVRGVTHAPSPRQIAKVRALSATGLVGTAAYAYYARQTATTAKGPRPPNALGEDMSSGLMRLKFADAETIVRAMIAAAAADGENGHGKEPRILRHLRQAGATQAEHAYVEGEARHPASPEELAAEIGDQETAMELYAAALLATEGASTSAQRFLARLALALDLPIDFLRALHATWGETVPSLSEPMEPTTMPR